MENYVIDDVDSFELKDIFECGQCFRWNKKEDGSYVGVIKDTVVKVEKQDNKIIFTGSDNKDFSSLIIDYFDLKTNYSDYKNKLKKVDKYMNESIKFGEGIRILKQDLWETIISFIISANNNIPRIKRIIENISKEYGKRIKFEGENYYTFPTIESLRTASVQDLRKLGLGFRDKRIFNTTQMIDSRKVELKNICNMQDTLQMREELLKLDGVGPKVADCILLFSLHRFDVFPIDVWVRRVMNDLYIHNNDENKVNKKEILKLADEKFGKIKGLAQQYLFYWKREEN